MPTRDEWAAKSCACYARGNCGCGNDILRGRVAELEAEDRRLREGLRLVETAMDRDHRFAHGAADCLAAADDMVAALLAGDDLREDYAG